MSDETLGRWPIKCGDIPVAWGEMDAFGHVNNTVYLRWFETARIAYFQRTISAVSEQDSVGQPAGIGPILARATIDFRIPLTFPDTIAAWGTIVKLGTTSFVMHYKVTSAAHDDNIAAEGEGVVVMLDYQSGKKVALTESLRQAIFKLEATGLDT